MDSFGCCSHYQKCSNVGNCLFPVDETYEGCQYNKNLSKGLNFYSPSKSILTDTKNDKKLYIDCYERNFKIGRLGKNGFSYPLDITEMDMITAIFDQNKIPYCNNAEIKKCIMEGTIEEPANSRVIFTISGYDQQFVLSNYNAGYILKRFADGICKALLKKGIIAEVSLSGPYATK